MQYRPQPIRRILLHRRQRVRIGRERHHDPLVTQALLHDVRRNARMTIDKWRDGLAADEIGQIYESVKDVSCSFYSDAEW